CARFEDDGLRTDLDLAVHEAAAPLIDVQDGTGATICVSTSRKPPSRSSATTPDADPIESGRRGSRGTRRGPAVTSRCDRPHAPSPVGDKGSQEEEEHRGDGRAGLA